MSQSNHPGSYEVTVFCASLDSEFAITVKGKQNKHPTKNKKQKTNPTYMFLS